MSFDYQAPIGRRLSETELADPEYMQSYVDECNASFDTVLKALSQAKKENAELKLVCDHLKEEVTQYKNENKGYREEIARLKEKLSNQETEIHVLRNYMRNS